ncbi:TPA: hypothetical protein ACXDAY_002279 [Clostridium botulinum]|nr:hypothetical protein [Clostridium botulinum]APH20986.1 hypothetical protein NPD1_4094 [Clostridium botulinum]APQ71268.1 hypothetical protein RSJ8_4330 [Clostridium botulinum]APR02355.1 hypothetical protein RSJ2_4192 [Clostridium botulinum]NFH75672.1 glycogen synthase [Clostridium botulinum]
MRKISAILKTQASHQFRQKRQEVIKRILKQNSTSNKSFQEYLDLYKLA